MAPSFKGSPAGTISVERFVDAPPAGGAQQGQLFKPTGADGAGS
jgi:hypothetical protein